MSAFDQARGFEVDEVDVHDEWCWVACPGHPVEVSLEDESAGYTCGRGFALGLLFAGLALGVFASIVTYGLLRSPAP